MDKRCETILNCIVEHYVRTADPIGSRALSKLLDIKLSAATIRNVMSDLTDMGLIEQPHTSAGRIPTDEGYRYYVNRLLVVEEISDQGIAEQVEFEPDNPNRLEDILRQAANELSLLTNCTGVVISPQFAVSKLKKIEFILLSEKQVLVVLVTQSGMVRNKIIQLRESPTPQFLTLVSEFLGDLFEGMTMYEIRRQLVGTMSKESFQHEDMLPQAIRLGKKAFDFDGSGEVYISGRSNMCRFPEFQKQEDLSLVYRMLDEKRVLMNIFSQIVNSGGLQVKIGNENEYDGLGHCSIVATTYGNREYLLGSIGIIGPTRISYSDVIPVIDYSSQKLSNAVSQFLD